MFSLHVAKDRSATAELNRNSKAPVAHSPLPAGNQARLRSIAQLAAAKHDGPAEAEPVPGTQSAAVPAAPAPMPGAASAAEPGSGTSGTIADIRTPPGQGRSTTSESAAGPRVAADPASPDAAPVTANFNIRFSQPKVAVSGGGKYDPVTSGVTMGAFSQPGGRAVNAFGKEFYEPAFTGISYAFAGGKCTISGTLDTICPWGTNAGGDTDVPSATDPVVTKTSFPQIKADLTPEAASPFKSPRDQFYSQSLVERHEKFHGTDDLGWTTGTGLGIVKTQLEAGSVAAATAAADVARVVDQARVKLIAENLTWYKGGGASHDSFAGEIRAYADGRPLYQALADAVDRQGAILSTPAPAPGASPAQPAPPPPPAPAPHPAP
ncbi:MAG: hypothetical protein ABSG96_04720 [Terracidiphilus sp.]|jgi:hypothetical protein